MIPEALLQRLSVDPAVPANTRAAMHLTLAADKRWRGHRRKQSLPQPPGVPSAEYDCQHTEVLPGVLILDPASSGDADAIRCDRTTGDLLHFYEEVFGRHGIDGMGGQIRSSIHYGVAYVNAAWDSQEMIYGDGDGVFFLSFTLSSDFIGHELTHGVTEHTAGLEYLDEPGALNESISDVFGSMFRQWLLEQESENADWKIGTDIMGPVALERGWVCVRDLSDPKSPKSATWQPTSYKEYIPNGDVHVNSGIGNHAFFLASMRLGGRSWERIGKVWYAALTSPFANSRTDYREFANLCISAAAALFPDEPLVAQACQYGWEKVHVL